MADRKAELEKKRKKLDELRKARELKKNQAVDKEVQCGCMVLLCVDQSLYDKIVTIYTPLFCTNAILHRSPSPSPQSLPLPGNEKMSTNSLVI